MATNSGAGTASLYRLAGIPLARQARAMTLGEASDSAMDGSLGQLMRVVIGAGVETFVAAAGQALEHDALPPADHRPWALPREPWVMAQAWQNALFIHWPLPPATLRRFVPPGVALDTRDGTAWLGITAFVVSGARI